jgi:D-threo-aldose 1-dehydrogenase
MTAEASIPARVLPGTDIALTELGLGTGPMGNLYTVTTDAQAAAAFDAAWSAGVRYFDTAPHYGLGLSERRLGALLRGRRGYVLSTKVGRLLEPVVADGLDPQGFAVPATHRRVWDFSADGVRRSLDESLDRLGLDHVDIVYVHDPDDHWEQAAREAVPALVKLRDEGVIEAVGVGINRSAPAARFVRETDVDVVMIAGRYTLLDQGALDDLLPAALDRGVAVVAAAVYNSGLLARPRPAPDATYDYGPAPRQLLDRADRLADVCERHGVTLPAAAVGFALRHPAVVSVVAGARDRAEVQAAVDRYRTTVPPEVWTEMVAEGLLR